MYCHFVTFSDLSAFSELVLKSQIVPEIVDEL